MLRATLAASSRPGAMRNYRFLRKGSDWGSAAAAAAGGSGGRPPPVAGPQLPPDRWRRLQRPRRSDEKQSYRATLSLAGCLHHCTPCMPARLHCIGHSCLFVLASQRTPSCPPAAVFGAHCPSLQVLQLLSDNLASTPQSLGDSKKESAEELADRHERVLAATCGALAALLELAAPPSSAGQPGAAAAAAAAEPSAAEQEVLAGIQSQLELPAFYKSVLQSKAAPVRRAAYGLVAAAAERRPQLLAGSLAVSAAAVLGALGDKEPANHEAMWGMLLAYARAAPDSWGHINMQKAFLPRLWALLRHGCHGSATASYPALLPLVSLLPQVSGRRVTFVEAWWGLPICFCSACCVLRAAADGLPVA